MRGWNQKYFGNPLWNSFSVGKTVVNETLPGQTQSRIARSFSRSERVIFNNNFEWRFTNSDYSMSNSVNLATSKGSFYRQ